MTAGAPAIHLKDRVFRDPVHGLVEFKGEDRPLADLLDTHAMQRLRRIKQMGFAWLVYPGAEHSRFGHALGAFHIAQRVTTRLALEPTLARHVKVAALLHDIGHGPFSHAWEHVFAGQNHEHWGGRIVAEDAELGAALERLEPGLPATMRTFWTKAYKPHFARKLVSSQLDVDRLDYLLRDGHYSGAGYATYDLDWIIHAIQVANVHVGHDDPSDLVVDYRRGMYAVEQYLFARSYMYAQVYHHKTVRAAEWMFIKTLERFAQLARQDAEPAGLPIAAAMARGTDVPVADYLRLHDVSLTTALDQWSGLDGDRGAEDPVLRDLARRLVDRRLFKTFDLGDDKAAADRVWPHALEIANRVFGGAARSYLHLDTARQVGYLAAEDEELHVIDHPRYGAVTLSRLLEDMPLGQPMAAIRLVCAPELVDELRPIVEHELARGRGRK
ncbi:MAG: HD domain-containing protein [Deltaproteobacteria bacterium]|nr:HD domain-containing protein [Deltaproteobacteria bacterium]MDQ3298290.1 HD domain-containing protein [Myxococcota bacterium]